MAWWWGCNLGSHSWRAGGPVLSPSSVTTRPQRSRDRICSGPLCSNFLVKGWSSLCSRKENKMLSSGCARPGSIRDASIAMTRIVHYCSQHFVFYPSLCSLLWEGEKGPACPSSSACTGRVPWVGQARVPRHGTGCHSSDMGKTKVPRAQDRLALT